MYSGDMIRMTLNFTITFMSRKVIIININHVNTSLSYWLISIIVTYTDFARKL